MRINNLIPENTEGFGGEKPPSAQVHIELQFLVDGNKKSNTRKLQFYVELALPYVACTTFAQENVPSELLLKWI